MDLKRLEQSAQEGSALSTPRIAIVDDDELVRDATMSLIESLGYNGVGFLSGEQFLQSEHFHKVSCLITYVQMPGLSVCPKTY